MHNFTLDVNTYLARIGAQRPAELTPEALSKLVRAHLEQVPFETLELTEGHTEPSLEPEALFDKIVTHRRGGYCFELNKLFYLLLRELGFDCRSVAVRCIIGRPEPRNLSHRGIVVTFGPKKWYCDVGFGGNGPKDILRLDTDEVQTLHYERFRVLREDGDYLILYFDGDTPVRMLKFRDEPWLDVDFQVLSTYYALYPHSPFRCKRILYRCIPDGWLGLVEHSYKHFCRGALTEQEITDEDQLRALVKSKFGLTIPQWETI